MIAPHEVVHREIRRHVHAQRRQTGRQLQAGVHVPQRLRDVGRGVEQPGDGAAGASAHCAACFDDDSADGEVAGFADPGSAGRGRRERRGAGRASRGAGCGGRGAGFSDVRSPARGDGRGAHGRPAAYS